MFKKEFGVSLYPEKSNIDAITEYLIKAKKYGFTRLFLSWLQVKNSKKYEDLYKKTINEAKRLGFYVILDVCDNNFDFYQSLGIDCIRLDSPALPKEVADATYKTKLDIQLNISNNDSFIKNVLDYEPVKENIYGCHNFYPQLNTGLGWEFFKKSTKRFNDLGIHASAFINSQVGKIGPQPFIIENGVTTIETLRHKPIRSQAKYLLATKQVDAIFIGNQFASDEELQAIATIDTKVIELDLILNSKLKLSSLELDIIKNVDHFSRGDINKNYLRSTMSRVTYKDRGDIKPTEKSLVKIVKGDVFIFNSNEPNYQKELIIITNDKMSGLVLEKVNYIGRIADYDLDLIDLVKAWQHFKFRIIVSVE